MTKEAHKYLLDFGIKPSVQRIAIMEYLLTHRTHPTVDEIFNALYSYIPTLSKTTVYNTLKLFTEKGAIQMLDIDRSNSRFDADISSHAHFLCSCCGIVYDVKLSSEIGNRLTDTENGFNIKEVQIYYKGVCPKCEQKIT